jgi:very-short-patch-repair endonuclease
LIVEADGGQHNENERDEVRDAYLWQQGFRVLRFWNNDVLSNTEGVLEVIFNALEESPSPGALRAPPSPPAGERGK